MALKSIPIQNEKTPQCLNIGCGRRYHRAWTNLDLEANEPTVIRHDVTLGVPFDEGHFDAVYHSHVLEHLRPQQGRELITECYRVLKPGGLLRIVVPDLERHINGCNQYQRRAQYDKGLHENVAGMRHCGTDRLSPQPHQLRHIVH